MLVESQTAVDIRCSCPKKARKSYNTAEDVVTLALSPLSSQATSGSPNLPPCKNFAYQINLCIPFQKPTINQITGWYSGRWKIGALGMLNGSHVEDLIAKLPNRTYLSQNRSNPHTRIVQNNRFIEGRSIPHHG